MADSLLKGHVSPAEKQLPLQDDGTGNNRVPGRQIHSVGHTLSALHTTSSDVLPALERQSEDLTSNNRRRRLSA